MATQPAGVQVADVRAWPWKRGRLRRAQRALPHRHRPHVALHACSERRSCTSTGMLVHCPRHMPAASWWWQQLNGRLAQVLTVMVHVFRLFRVNGRRGGSRATPSLKVPINPAPGVRGGGRLAGGAAGAALGGGAPGDGTHARVAAARGVRRAQRALPRARLRIPEC